MPTPRVKRLLEPDDLLNRRVQPGQCDTDGLHPTAFQHKYQDLSLFVARITQPAEVLARFARFPAVMRACGTRDRAPTPDEMYEAGYRIAVIPYEVIVT